MPTADLIVPSLSSDADLLPVGYGNTALIRQQARLRDREADLKERIKAARETAAPQGRIVSGHYVAPSMGQMLTPIAQQIAGEIDKRGLEADQTGYDALEMAAVRQHIAKIPSDDAPQAEKLAWAERGAVIPALRSMMNDYAKDQLLGEPERQAARAERKDRQTLSIAEARRKQQEDLDYRRERDASGEQLKRDLADQSNTLRRDLTAAMRARAGGGSSGGDGGKASDWQLVTDDNGNVTRVNKLTGEAVPVGAKAGKSQAALVSDQLKQSENRSNAAKALQDLDQAEKLLPVATGSKVGSLRDTIAGAAGYATGGAKAAAELDPIANAIVANIPRMAGQVSDADLAFLKKQGGDLANKELPADVRLAALKQVRRIMQRAASGQASPGAAAAAPAAPSIRQAVESAISKPPSDEDLLNKYLKR